MDAYKLVDKYIEEWYDSGHIWANECQGTAAERQLADELYHEVLKRLEAQGQLAEHTNPRRIWDYCVGNTTVDDVINEL